MLEKKDNFANIVSVNKWRFLAYFVVVGFITFTFLYLMGLVPAVLKSERGESFGMIWDRVITGSSTPTITKKAGEIPLKIQIPAVGVDAPIYNPNSTEVSVLDDYLLRGAVRYPGSGLAGEGNMFIFGHSTGYRVVNNQAYKTFSGLKNIKAGDEIKIYSESKVYLYRVDSVSLAEASEITVRFDNGKDMLTLSTCNSFGSKEERYVVTAYLVN